MFSETAFNLIPFFENPFKESIMMKKTLSVLLLLSVLSFFVFCFFSCDGAEKKKEYTTRTKIISYGYFNTESRISSYGDMSAEEFDNYVKISDEILGYYHKLFDIYYEYSGVNNIRTINKNAGKSAVQVDEELIDFLEYCKELYYLTNGKTNIMLGSLLRVWHDTREEASDMGGILDESLLPTEEMLLSANEHTSIDSLVIDRDAKTVYITDPKASIDVGAVGKGYAAGKLADRLKELGADSMAINAGGNIVTIGLKPDGENWVTGISNPDKSASVTLLCRVEIGEAALVTSGDYERYFMSGGKRYHHIIDPKTLVPAEYFSAVSVFAKDSGLADALSTALFCMSYEDGLALVEGLDGVEVIWVDTEYNMTTTDGVKLINEGDETNMGMLRGFLNKYRIELIVIVSLLFISLIIFLCINLSKTEGAFVEVKVAGEVVGTYALDTDGVYSLNGGSNTLTIKDGVAYMTYSDCPDHTCEKVGKVRYVGESITCLPNKLTIVVVGKTGDGVDLVS